MKHEEKVQAVREYLERWCIGWESRRLGAVIVCQLRGRGYAMSEEAFQHITKELMLSGVAVCSDDTKATGGYFIACCRREMMEYIQQLDRRVDGTLTRRNCARKLMDEKWPQRELAFDAALVSGRRSV